ncbi:MAG TPA: class I SAM-dependent methyltransferase [Gemmatimonadaceae bacterium]
MNESRLDRERWEARYAEAAPEPRPPSPWIMEAIGRLPADLTIVDLAAGSGRHARPIAESGRVVVAVDFVERAVRAAVAGHPRIHGVVADAAALPFRSGTLDAIVVVNFLDRALFPQLVTLLRPGGYLVYETYTEAHLTLVQQGRARAPRDPRYLLRPGELRTLVAPLAVIDEREGLVRDEAGERYCASVIARRDALA